MKSKEGFSISGITLTEQGINKDSGKFVEPTAFECLEDGALKITWKDGTNVTYTHFVAGMANTILCKEIEVVAGRFNISWAE